MLNSSSNLKDNSPFDIPALTFHKVDSRWEWGATRVTPSQFKRIIVFLKDQGYQTITLSQAKDTDFQRPDKPIILTFDDAYESLFENAYPILLEHGFTASIFVITDFVGLLNTWDVNLGWLKFRHMSWDQIQEMSRSGIEFGSHTHRHPDLTRVSENRVRHELSLSKKILEDKLGSEIRFVAYPFGRFNSRIVDLSRDTGFHGACAFWNQGDDKKERFVFERKAYYLFDTIWNLKAKLGKSVLTKIESAKLRAFNFCSRGTSLVKPSR